jgi:hypothetical protein
VRGARGRDRSAERGARGQTASALARATAAFSSFLFSLDLQRSDLSSTQLIRSDHDRISSRLKTQVNQPDLSSTQLIRSADLKSDLLFLSKPICIQYDLKFRGEEQSAGQSTENTRSDKPSNLIPHDKGQAGDPMSFVLIFHSESNRINNLPITRRTSPEEEERIQQAT